MEDSRFLNGTIGALLSGVKVPSGPETLASKFVYPPSCFGLPLTRLQSEKALNPLLGLNRALLSTHYPLHPIIDPLGRETSFGRGLTGFGNRGEDVRNAILNRIVAERLDHRLLSRAGIEGNASAMVIDKTLPGFAPWEHWTKSLVNPTSSSIDSENKKPFVESVRDNDDKSNTNSANSSMGEKPSLPKFGRDNKYSKKIYIDKIQDLDVLCGRGRKSNYHRGNTFYRQVVNEMKMKYRKIDGWKGKTNISEAIVDHVIDYGGRFVKKEDSTGKYYLISHAEARKKTSQALREIKEAKKPIV